MIILSCPVADFASTVVGGQKVCLSLADKFKFCRANFLEHQQRHKKNNFNLTEIINNKKVVLINCEGLDDEATAFLGCLITNQIKSHYLHQAKVGGNPLFFYCDEFHLFIQEHFGRFSAEGRKYNFCFNFAGHSFALLDTMFRAMVLRCHVKVILGND